MERNSLLSRCETYLPGQIKAFPKRWASFVEAEPNSFKSAGDATVADWRTATRLAKQTGEREPVGARKLLHAAKLLGIPEDVPLVPRLKALAASGNVTTIAQQTFPCWSGWGVIGRAASASLAGISLCRPGERIERCAAWRADDAFGNLLPGIPSLSLRGLVLRHCKHGAGERAVGLS
jgi:hypothetical protein